MGNATARTLTDIPVDDLEIVGFNGKPLVECGSAFAAARQISTDRYFALTNSSLQSDIQWYSSNELDDFRKVGRLTLLPHSVRFRAFVRSTGELKEVPLVVWVAEPFLEQATSKLPPAHLGQEFDWQLLPDEKRKVWVACVPQCAAAGILDHWADLLKQRADELLTRGEAVDWQQVKALSDLGLIAAEDKRLRFALWVRYLSAIASSPEPEKAPNLFKLFCAKEFPGTTWERTLVSIKNLRDSLSARRALQMSQGHEAKSEVSRTIQDRNRAVDSDFIEIEVWSFEGRGESVPPVKKVSKGHNSQNAFCPPTLEHGRDVMIGSYVKSSRHEGPYSPTFAGSPC